MKTLFKDENGDMINYYEVLNVPRDAKKLEIRTSFCTLIKRYHPDLAGEDSDIKRRKTELLIRGYKILVDDAVRSEYDRELFSGNRVTPMGYVLVPKTRIRYSVSLDRLVKSRLLNKKIRHRERLYNFGQDIEIFITPAEASAGITAIITLPSRIACPLCFGQNPECHICHGVGRIGSTTPFEITVPGMIQHSSFFDFDLLGARPDRFTSFTMKALRVKFSVIGRKD